MDRDKDALYDFALEKIDRLKAEHGALVAEVRAWSTRWFLGLGGARDELNAILARHDETGQ